MSPRRVLIPVLLLAVAGCGRDKEEAVSHGVPTGVVNPQAVDEVIAAERAFSAASESEGPRRAFLDNFADSVVTFGPGPVVGTAALAAGPDFGPLTWEPEVAEASAAGDMGYTGGPYRAPRGETTAYGHYYSMWRKGSDGTWRVILDIGGPHGQPAPVTTVARPRSPLIATTGKDAETGRDELLVRESQYRSAYARDGADVAFGAFSFDRVRVYRPGELPLVGRDSALADETGAAERLTWETVGAGASVSSDLGYTYGTGTIERVDLGDEARAMSYARFWRRDADGRWRVVVEVVRVSPR